jgi:hypothetical protein
MIGPPLIGGTGIPTHWQRYRTLSWTDVLGSTGTLCTVGKWATWNPQCSRLLLRGGAGVPALWLESGDSPHSLAQWAVLGLCALWGRKQVSWHLQNSKMWSLGSTCIWQWISWPLVASCLVPVKQQRWQACAFHYHSAAGCSTCLCRGIGIQEQSRAAAVGIGEQSQQICAFWHLQSMGCPVAWCARAWISLVFQGMGWWVMEQGEVWSSEPLCVPGSGTYCRVRRGGTNSLQGWGLVVLACQLFFFLYGFKESLLLAGCGTFWVSFGVPRFFLLWGSYRHWDLRMLTIRYLPCRFFI